MQPRRKPSRVLLALLVALGALGSTAPASSAAPTCAEGPQTVGNTIVGTPCDDTIRAPRGVTTVEGEGGNDTLYGQRGNDTVNGGEGNDRLYGGIGDDELGGGEGNDHLSGGFGADSLDGGAGSDFARGDATIDAIADNGAGDTDTLSYATGATPGFFNKAPYPDFSDYAGFPGLEDGRGAYVNLQSGKGDNGLAPAGGGVDEEVAGTSFETVIGSAFPDFIVGTSDDETIYGGGGADVILGEGGDDLAYGGADGDSCEAATTLECETSDEEVDLRDPGAIAVGLMAPQSGRPAALYLTGSDEDDEVTAGYTSGSVTFALDAGSEGGFDMSPSAAGNCGAPAAGTVVCSVAGAPDSIVLAGLDGEDSLSAAGFPATTSVVLLGGDDGDQLTGGATEDALVDGPGNDTASASGGDDAVPNNDGNDDLDAGSGEDLFVSDSICDGDVLDGGPDRDNANWANFDVAVAIDMRSGSAGLIGPGEEPQCPSEPLLTALEAIEDIEGTSLGDILLGDSGPNQLLGRPGDDTYRAADGDDSILANSGDSDSLIDCGEGFDTAQIDIPTHTATKDFEDAAPDANCEDVEERAPNSFRPPKTPPDPNPGPPGGAPSPPPPAVSTRPPRDRIAPRTSLLHHPAKTVFTATKRRRVAFAFASNEPGATFRCKLDGGPIKRCRSPRSYTVPVGAHAVRIRAIDGAGNRDPSPTLFRFRVRRR